MQPEIKPGCNIPENIPSDEFFCPYQDRRMVLLTGTSNMPLAEEIGRILHQDVEQPVTLFKNGEVHIEGIKHDLSRKDVFIIQSPCLPNINDHIMQLLLMIDTVKRASAAEITVIMPNFPYARQDRKNAPRVPISASLIANLLNNSGADRIVTVDLHAEQTEGSILAPWDNLYASHSLAPEIEKGLDTNNAVIVSPDLGGVKRASLYAKKLHISDIAVIYKERDVHTNGSKSLFLIGDVENKKALITDDLLQTAISMVDGSLLLDKHHAKSINAVVTHGEFIRRIDPKTGLMEDALQRIADSPIEKVLVTDSLNLRDEVRSHPKVQVVSIAPLLADAIQRIHRGQPLHPLFD